MEKEPANRGSLGIIALNTVYELKIRFSITAVWHSSVLVMVLDLWSTDCRCLCYQAV